VLPKQERIGGLTDEEIALLAEAFRALRRDRSHAWNAACDIAESQGERRPSLRPYGIDDIKRWRAGSASPPHIGRNEWRRPSVARSGRRLLAVAAEWNRKGA
jgi:hypothetical protein